MPDRRSDLFPATRPKPMRLANPGRTATTSPLYPRQVRPSDMSLSVEPLHRDEPCYPESRRTDKPCRFDSVPLDKPGSINSSLPKRRAAPRLSASTVHARQAMPLLHDEPRSSTPSRHATSSLLRPRRPSEPSPAHSSRRDIPVRLTSTHSATTHLPAPVHIDDPSQVSALHPAATDQPESSHSTIRTTVPPPLLRAPPGRALRHSGPHLSAPKRHSAPDLSAPVRHSDPSPFSPYRHASSDHLRPSRHSDPHRTLPVRSSLTLHSVRSTPHDTPDHAQPLRQPYPTPARTTFRPASTHPFSVDEPSRATSRHVDPPGHLAPVRQA